MRLVTKLLIEGRCNMDLQEKVGYTAQLFAIGNEHASVSKQLMKRAATLIFLTANGAHRSTPQPKVGMMPSRSC
jgi:ankyrin repeat protein